MAVLRQANLLGDQRVDVPHLRALESAMAADFDVVAGRVQAGGKALIIRGFELSNYSTGTSTSSIQLNTADGVLYNQNATEAGTFLWVPLDRPVEVLDSALNARVDGSFVAGTVNYIGLDLVRSADATTTDHVKFMDAYTLLEQGYEVPLARTLDYRIVITSTPFSALPHLTSIAKITSDANNQVVTVEDARNIMWRLGSGGDFPSSTNSFAWPQDRVESAGAFAGGDKGILSQKDWQDAVMSRVWEIGGGENWYSPTADRNVKMAGNPGSLFSSTADNFEWVAGLYSSTHLHWKGLKFLFDNANVAGVYYNTITDQLVDDPSGSAATSRTALAVGDCLYVDLDRSSNATLTAQKAAMQALGEPAVPGSRVIIAWRNADGVFRRDGTFAVNTSFAPATTVAIGAVRLASAAGTTGTPTVPTLDSNNTIRVGEGSYPVTYTGAPAIYGTSSGTGGYGVEGYSVGGTGIYGHATGVGSIGVSGDGRLRGVEGISSTDVGTYGFGPVAGVEGVSSGSGGYGVHGINTNTTNGANNYGVYGECLSLGTGTRIGIYGTGLTYGVRGHSAATAVYGGGGAVGIEGNGSSYGLYASAGDVAVTAAKNYVYATPVTHKIYVPASDFIYNTAGLALLADLGGLWLYKSFAGELGYASSKIRLPHGATITQVQCLAYNQDSVSGNMTVNIYHQTRAPAGAPGFTSVAVHHTTGATPIATTGGSVSSAKWNAVSIDLGPVAPDDGWTSIYFLLDDPGAPGWIGIGGFMVTYTYTKETPMR